MRKQKDVLIKFRGGGSIVALPPVFSEDSTRIYLAWKNVVLSYNTATAMRISEFTGLSHDIVGFGRTRLQQEEVVVACTVHGVVQIWHAKTALAVAKFKCKLDVCFFKLLGGDDDVVPKAFIAVRDSKNCKVAVMNLETSELRMQRFILKMKQTTCFDVSEIGQYYVITQGNRLFYNRFGADKGCRYTISNRKFTCLACHPELECVLTGDDSGRILLWHSLQGKPTQAVFHWHTNPVESLSFAFTGSCFYSGGSECVLVKWLVDDNVFKNFLPRLPGTVGQIAVARDNTLLAVATSDNAIQILNSRLDHVNVIQHLVLGSNFSVGVIYDPRSKAVILNGVVGHVQFYYPKDLSLLYNLDVTCQNKFTEERDVKIINTSVVKVALDKTGVWMSTVESRDDPEFPESRLKFWFFDSAKQNFALNTCVEEPHDGVITDVVFQPTYKKHDVMCVTSGRDGKFKVWKVVQVSTAHYVGQSWQCSSVVCYRDLAPNALAFATDGSLLAVAFDSIVTTWSPNSCELKCSLQHPSCREDLIHVSFGVGAQCHLLVSATTKLINVWNLLTLSLVWMVPVNVLLLISDPLTSFKAVFTSDKKIFVFEPKSPNLVFSDEKCLADVGVVKAACFVPRLHSSDMNLNWHQRSQIYFVDSNQEMYSIERNEKIPSTESIYDERTSNSLFSYTQPKVRSGLNYNASVTHLYAADHKLDKLNQLLESPAHTMPALHSTCQDILESMVLLNSPAETERGHDDGNNTNEAMPTSKRNVFELVDESKLTSLSEVYLEATSWMSIF